MAILPLASLNEANTKGNRSEKKRKSWYHLSPWIQPYLRPIMLDPSVIWKKITFFFFFCFSHFMLDFGHLRLKRPWLIRQGKAEEVGFARRSRKEDGVFKDPPRVGWAWHPLLEVESHTTLNTSENLAHGNCVSMSLPLDRELHEVTNHLCSPRAPVCALPEPN